MHRIEIIGTPIGGEDSRERNWTEQVAAACRSEAAYRLEKVILRFTISPARKNPDLDNLIRPAIKGLREAGWLSPRFVGLDSILATKELGPSEGLVVEPGVTFEQVKHAYNFDAILRNLLTDALELIEVDLCTSVAHGIGQKYGPFGHTNPANFHQRFDFQTTHASWLEKLHVETTRSNELFVHHFRRHYSQFPDLPIWAATEVMSFGGLSRMIGALHKHDRQAIAGEYGIPAVVLSSLTHHMAYVRNLCAHHLRLWDRKWSIKPDLPKSPDWKNANAVSDQKLFATLLLLRTMLLRSPQIRSEADKWRTAVTELLLNPPSVNDPIALMGLTIDWKKHPVWN